MGRLFNANGWLFKSGGGEFVADAGSPTCSYVEALKCSDGSHTGIWIRKDRTTGVSVAKRDADGICYTFDNICDPCKTDTFGTFTSFDDCSACTGSGAPPCRCAGAMFTNDGGTTYQPFPGTIANTAYTISGAGTLGLANDPAIIDNGLPPWDGVLQADPYSSPDPTDAAHVNSDSSGRSCQWSDEEGHKETLGLPFNPDGCGNSGKTVSGALLRLEVPVECNTPETFACYAGSITSTSGSYWSLIIGGKTASGVDTVWKGILVDSPTPAGVYKHCGTPGVDELNSYTGDLTVS